MTNHVSIFNRTELIYVYDSDDEYIRDQRRKKREKKERKNRKKTVPVKKYFAMIVVIILIAMTRASSNMPKIFIFVENV